MKNNIFNFILLLFVALILTACENFLEERPKGFLTTKDYYKNKAQTQAAVNGLYDGLDEYFVSAFGVAESPAWALEYITGYCTRPNTGNNNDFEFLNLSGIDIKNGYVERFWKEAGYFPIENCNSVIKIIPTLDFLNQEEKDNFMGQAYFLRAHYYFLLVRLFGDIPIKLEPTTNLDNIKIPKSKIEDVYNQIIKDLKAAEDCNLKWADHTGRVNMGAIKSLMAKVYLTMAGFPLSGGSEYYDKAAEKAKEVIDSKTFSLYKNFGDLRKKTNENYDEHIFMFQKMEEKNENIIHFNFLPNQQRISIVTGNVGGAMKPKLSFYNSYNPADKRIQEQAYFYTTYPRKSGGDQSFEPYIFKYWDAEAELSGRSGANIWNLRYADVLLMYAEAMAMLDGGSTTNQDAIDAYYEVRKRAMPSEAKPNSITFDQIYKERTWEFCFESQAYFDMQRTRKIFDLENNIIVNIIGYTTPGRNRAFIESDLLLPIPYSETIQNELLLED